MCFPRGSAWHGLRSGLDYFQECSKSYCLQKSRPIDLSLNAHRPILPPHDGPPFETRTRTQPCSPPHCMMEARYCRNKRRQRDRDPKVCLRLADTPFWGTSGLLFLGATRQRAFSCERQNALRAHNVYRDTYALRFLVLALVFGVDVLLSLFVNRHRLLTGLLIWISTRRYGVLACAGTHRCVQQGSLLLQSCIHLSKCMPQPDALVGPCV